MSLRRKIIAFIIGFSALFAFMRASEPYVMLSLDLGGIPWLYSTIGGLFSIIAAFSIQKEWENWNNLVEAEKNEIDSLEELWLWAEHLPINIRKKINELIREYLKVMIREGWQKSERGERSEDLEKILLELRQTIFTIPQSNHHLISNIFSLFSDLLGHRKDRLHFSTRHMPDILRYTLLFSMGLLTFLSLLIGIKNIWLAYVFTVSIATLAYTVFLVIIDLDNPLSPGGWHLTTKDYEDLLQRLKNDLSREKE